MKRSRFQTPIYAKISRFLLMLLIALLLKAGISAADAATPPIITTDKTPEQITEEIGAIMFAYFTVDVIMNINDVNLDKQRQSLLAGLTAHLKHSAPELLEGNVVRLMQREMYTVYMQMVIDNPAIGDWLFARSITIAYQLSTMPSEEVFNDFKIPDESETGFTYKYLMDNGYRSGGLLEAVNAYEAKYSLLSR